MNGRLFVTGDIHQSVDIHKLSSSNFKIKNDLTKNDILVITGDIGLVWNYGQTPFGEEKYWRNWLNNKPWTTFCTLGNHEAYNLIETFPIVEFCGGKARKISDSIYYEIRGEIYNLNGKICLSLGGAESMDKEFRTEGVSWWSQEQITEDDIRRARKNLKRYNYKVDYIFTHTGGINVNSYLGFILTVSDVRLDEILREIEYSCHYCGHYHVDMNVDEKTRILYNDILEI